VAKKNIIIALLLCFFLGFMGVHRFYLGRFGTGLLQIILGIFGSILFFIGIGIYLLGILVLWVVLDFILILTGVLKAK